MCNQALQWRRYDSDCTTGDFLFFARKVHFDAEIKREETQERATDVGPVKKKEKEIERDREREEEGRKDQKIEVSAPM